MIAIVRKYYWLTLIVTIFALEQSYAQYPLFDPIPSEDWLFEHIDSLKNTYLQNKTVPDDFESSIIAALMFFPELEKTHIKFKTKEISTTMAALPRSNIIFKKRGSRHYTVIINHKYNKLRAPLMSDVPYYARVGIIGHELSHIVDYQNKRLATIVGNGIAYSISKKFRRNLEYKIDRMTINRGLGEGLLAFRHFVENEAETTDRYKKFKEYVYMTSEEIAAYIEGLDNLAVED